MGKGQFSNLPILIRQIVHFCPPPPTLSYPILMSCQTFWQQVFVLYCHVLHTGLILFVSLNKFQIMSSKTWSRFWDIGIPMQSVFESRTRAGREYRRVCLPEVQRWISDLCKSNVSFVLLFSSWGVWDCLFKGAYDLFPFWKRK